MLEKLLALRKKAEEDYYVAKAKLEFADELIALIEADEACADIPVPADFSTETDTDTSETTDFNI